MDIDTEKHYRLALHPLFGTAYAHDTAIGWSVAREISPYLRAQSLTLDDHQMEHIMAGVWHTIIYHLTRHRSSEMLRHKLHTHLMQPRNARLIAICLQQPIDFNPQITEVQECISY